MLTEEMKSETGRCLKVLREGGVILYPTDTIWGLGCDATNEDAVTRIFRLKCREDSKAMIILIDHTSRLSSLLKEVPAQAYDLMELTESPLTLVLDGARNLAKNLIAEDGSIAIRLVLDEFCRNLITRLGKPIVSTSANLSGQVSPSGFADIDDRIKSGVDYTVALRQNEMTLPKPSTILRLGMKGEIKFIRK